ncbi:3-hydroxyacyl-CoA dehydrogenase [Rhodobacterales bacterium]|nr:3-hydroxyacyl-CoA dehydrogenase [Rhodobacterales bacterium]
MPVLTVSREGEFAIVTLDNPPVNAVSEEVRKGLVETTAQLDAEDSVEAVVLICAGRTFIAGADVREFGKPPVEPHLPDVVMTLEQACKPWVAAIHGSALGGGFEIAMGCRFRIADEKAKVGLPEVNLGIIPGASGTVRTPRLAGVDAAVELATGGKPLAAPRALEKGLIDKVVAGDLGREAVAFARDALKQPLPTPVSQRTLVPKDDAFWQAERVKAAKAGHSAPLAALEAIRFATTHSFDEAMAHERATFLDLRGSEEAAALRSVFFAERSATRPDFLKGIEPRKLSRIGVVGGGTMGSGIASACLTAGYDLVLIEQNDEALARGRANIEKTFDGAVKRGKMSEDGKARLMEESLSAATDYAALSDCDLVIEAVFEDIAVKRDVFAKLDSHCRADAILATNTSYLDPREIASAVSDASRFLGLHFFSPANIMKLLEIVPVSETAGDVLAAAFSLAAKLGKIPVRAGICEGFIGNRILKRYRAEAEALVRDGVAIADIDAAMRGFGFKMGPFEAQDLGGLDIAFLQREGDRKAGKDIPDTLGDILVRAGRKGQKASGGWYDYVAGDRTPHVSETVADLLGSSVTGSRTMGADEIASHLVGTMAAEGKAIVEEGIAESGTDIDLVEIHGYGFPRWKGGPMFWSERQSAS